MTETSFFVWSNLRTSFNLCKPVKTMGTLLLNMWWRMFMPLLCFIFIWSVTGYPSYVTFISKQTAVRCVLHF